MKTVDIYTVKAHFSKLIEQAANGEPFVIAISGKPMVKVVPLHEDDGRCQKRLGFMRDQIKIPDDFDQMGSYEITNLFGIKV